MNLPAISLYYGLESFLLEETCNQLREQVPEDQRDWNLLTLDLDDTPLEQVIEEAQTPSFFGDRRLIIVRNARFLTTAKLKKEPHHNVDALLNYIANPSEHSALVFTVISEKLDKRKKVVKQLEKAAEVTTFVPLKGQALLKWTLDRFRKHQVKISREDCIAFIQLVGNDLRLLAQECQKLALYVGAKGTVTADSIASLIPRTLEGNVFQLTEKLATRNVQEVWQIWEDLLTQKEEPIRILALITRQFRLLYQCKMLSLRGMGASEIAKAIASHPYPVKLALGHSDAFSLTQLKACLQLAITTDQEIKAGKVDKVQAVEQIFLQLPRITA